MKIGIMTLWKAFDNYGQQFQVYALQHYLRTQGYDAYIIRYEYRKDIRKKKWYEYFYTLRYLFDLSFIMTQLRKRFQNQNPKSIDRGFNFFAEKNIAFSEKIYNDIFELQANPPAADIYITGSDQVWNYSDQYKPYANKIQAFYLNFGSDKTKRIACAASFGRDEYGKSLRKYVKPFLDRFDLVTCRENQGVKICDSMGIKSELSLDPVFFNSKEEYLKLIMDTKLLVNEKFCLVYLLGNSTVVDFDKIEKYASENSCKIIFIPGKGLKQNRYEEIFPTPTEWLWYMNNAEFIITNSFHGTAFSIILNKNFLTLPLSGKNSIKQNDRILTMFGLLKISKDFIGLDNEPMKKNFCWKEINNNIIKYNEKVGLLNFIKE